ncbi:MAG: PEGA domain-containing protein [Myxococcales bacterium]|nr:PEGA domain-containing protein [Myxococcales bacterium]
MISALLIAMMLAAPPKEPRPAAAAAPETAGLAKAKELVQWGQKLYKQARYAEAIAKFEEAYLARPSPVITYNIGKCHEQLGETAKAMRAYRDYLRLSPNAADRESVSDAITNLERRLREKGLQQLMVFADPPTAKISVDGKELGNSPVSIELIAGNHTLSVTAEGYEKTDRAFVMQLSRATEMTIALRPSPPPTDAPKAVTTTEPKPADVALTPGPALTATVEKKARVWTWVAGGVAVAGVGAGVGLGVVSNAKAVEHNTVVRGPDAAAELRRDSQTMATAANISYAVAGVAAVTAIILFVVEK